MDSQGRRDEKLSPSTGDRDVVQKQHIRDAARPEHWRQMLQEITNRATQLPALSPTF